MSYAIVRFYQHPHLSPEVIDEGLTLEEAQEHCDDPETCSRTCLGEEGDTRTMECGPWFDGYREE